MKSFRLAALLTLALAITSAVAQDAPYVTPDTPLGTGRHPAVMLAEPTLPTHTVYRPKALATLGDEKLPVVVWGNGACVNTGNRFRHFLTEIASHGFLVVALGPIGPAEVESSAGGMRAISRGQPAAGSPAAVMAAGGRLLQLTPGVMPPPYTTANQFIDAIDWAIAENQRAGSPLAGRIDTQAIAVMGQSCGGLQAIDAARDRRVKALGVWNSGLFPEDGRAWQIAAARFTKADLGRLHTPALYVSGDPSDIAFANADDDFDRIAGVPVVRAWRDKTGHGGTYNESHGGAFGPVGVAWLRWQLKGDDAAARMFTGERCGLCTQPEWHVRKKRLD
ncbi:alpha/beta hydrolase [Roseateles sp. P5_E7]